MLQRVLDILREEGLGVVMRRAGSYAGRWATERSRERGARRRGSYARAPGPRCLERRLALSRSISEAECIRGELAAHYLEHRFDLLGSGWVQVRHGMTCRGLGGFRYATGAEVSPDAAGEWLDLRINVSNRAHARSIWRRVDPGYRPIDWQVDFKSGHRWSEGCWAKRLKYGIQPGVDVKVPWELARMQHLPQLALRALALGKDSPEAVRLAREARNQMFDFMASNPPGFGVNWLCPMDVAIRGANWAIAWDLLASAGFASDATDEGLLVDGLYDHGRFVAANLEWSPIRGNHYLSHVCGLAFIAAYLPESEETNGWLSFALGELNGEVLQQFHADGGQFEGSIAYHRLCTEMVLYTVGLALGLPEARLRALRRDLDPIALQRLRTQVDFFAAILKPDGTFPQIGDNDSGRFFKISPTHARMRVEEAKRRYANLDDYAELPDSAEYFLENTLAGRHLLEAASALGWRSEKSETEGLPFPEAAQGGIEERLLSGLAGGRVISEFTGVTDSVDTIHPAPREERDFCAAWDMFSRSAGSELREFFFSPEADLIVHPVRFRKFEGFGLYVFHHPRFYLSVRCLTRPEVHVGAHFHADQLSVELEIDGTPCIRDPGTYVYTPLLRERNRYRAVSAHATPLPDTESLTGNVFGSLAVVPAAVDYFGPLGFAGSLPAAGGMSRLLIRIDASGIGIQWHGRTACATIPYSPGYGIQERTSE